MKTILDAIDILCDSVSAMHVDTVCKKHRAAYKSGWKEPNFTAAKVSDLKSRRPITNQEEFIYTAEKQLREKILLNMQPGTIAWCTKDSNNLWNLTVLWSLLKSVRQQNLAISVPNHQMKMNS